MLSRASSSASSLTVCARCLRSAALPRALHVSASVAGKFDRPPRSSTRTQGAKPAYGSSFRPPTNNRNGASQSHVGSFRGPPPQKRMVEATPDKMRAKLSSELRRWIRAPRTLDRLHVIGLEDDHSRRLLQIFAEEEPRSHGGWFPPAEDDRWQMQRVVDDSASGFQAAIDGALTRRFLQWTLDTVRTPGRRIVPPQSRAVLEAVYEALDYTQPHMFPTFRSARMIKRKIHMHVGPTNSGKTHNALSALAAARHGVYASPLRLLAHEVFERLNSGQICPAGLDLDSDRQTWKRPCNLTTGEEVRVADESAGLLSCTIEMLKFGSRFDVAVIDEIQMLADQDRGGAWTAAVLGLHAAEIHLCGEEAAVPLVKKMLEETGDEVIVHKYERLTPLVAAPKSLRGDFKNIEKGDCIVSFSRTKLFDLKERIEKVSGMRCAIIYGRLPPEVRAEQAELFNTPGSGYDVLVGSDAIGMGLNLKIKRIVFETVTKFDGMRDIKLSLSQLKQIAGRAGRFGLHDSDDSGGVVTTLNESDLPTVRKAVANPVVPTTKRALIPNAELDTLTALSQAVRPNTGLRDLFDLQRTAGRIMPHYAFPPGKREHETIFETVDGSEGRAGDAALHERIRVLNAPIQWRDASVLAASKRFLEIYANGDLVPFKDACKDTDVLGALEEVKAMQARAKKLMGSASDNVELHSFFNPVTQDSESHEEKRPAGFPMPQLSLMLRLESLYRIAVVYMWFSLRLPLCFAEREIAVQTKGECEDAIEWCLEVMRASKKREKMARKGVKPEYLGDQERDFDWSKLLGKPKPAQTDPNQTTDEVELKLVKAGAACV